MPATTAKHALPYPLGSELSGVGDTGIKNLAVALDNKISFKKEAYNFKQAKNLCSYEEVGDAPGFLVIDTNISFGNHMVTLYIKGFIDRAYNNIIDCTISFYAYEPANGEIHNYNFRNNGSVGMENIYIAQAGGKVSIFLLPYTPSFNWYSPHVWVDGTFGHVEISDASIKTGWGIRRCASTSGVEIERSVHPVWQNPTYANSWSGHANRPCQYMKSADGWIRFRGMVTGGTMGVPAIVMPYGYRPESRVSNDHHYPVTSSTSFGMVGINASTGDLIMRTGANSFMDLSSLTYRSGPT